MKKFVFLLLIFNYSITFAQKWQGIQFDIKGGLNQKLAPRTIQKSVGPDGYDVCEGGYKVTEELMKEADLFQDWLKDEAKTTGNFFLQEAFSFWGIADDIKHDLFAKAKDGFDIDNALGDNGETFQYFSVIQIGSAFRYFLGCSNNLWDTAFYPILGHEVGHILADLMYDFVYLKERSPLGFYGVASEFFARVTELYFMNKLNFIPKTHGLKDFDEDDEHIGFLAAECWYSQKPSLSERKKVFHKLFSKYNAQNNFGRDYLNTLASLCGYQNIY